MPSVLPLMMTERKRSGPTELVRTPDGADIRDLGLTPGREGNRRPQLSSKACSMGLPGPTLDSAWTPQGTFCGDRDSKKTAPQLAPQNFPAVRFQKQE